MLRGLLNWLCWLKDTHVVLAIDLPSPSLVLATQTMDWMAKSGRNDILCHFHGTHVGPRNLRWSSMGPGGFCAGLQPKPPGCHAPHGGHQFHSHWIKLDMDQIHSNPQPPNGSKWIYTFEPSSFYGSSETVKQKCVGIQKCWTPRAQQVRHMAVCLLKNVLPAAAHPDTAKLLRAAILQATMFPWYSHDFPWFSHDFPMIFPWFSHDFPMIFPWFSSDFAMIVPWYSHDFPVILQW